MRLRLFSLLLLLTLALAPAATATGVDKAPGSSRWVDADFDLVQPTLLRIELSGALHVHKYVIGGSPQSASEMSANFGSMGETYVGDVERAMRADLAASLASAFPGATITVTSATVDRASLAKARVDDYAPTIDATVAATIDRSRESVGLGTLSDAAVAAAFAAGARVQAEPTLIADPGYKATYTIHAPAAPAGLVFAQGSAGTRATDGKTVTTTLDNTAGASAKLQITTLFLRDASASAPTSEDIRNVVELTLGAPQANATTLPVAIKITGEMRAIDPDARLRGVLPTSVTLDYVSADGMRALYQAGAISDAQLASADASLLAEAKKGLANAFGAGVEPQGGLSRADLAAPADKPYDAEPPVTFAATALASYTIPGEHAKDLDLALDIGATVKFDFDLYSSSEPSTFVLHAPEGSEFTEARGGGVLARDQRSARFDVPANAASPTAGLSMRKAGAPTFSHENATLRVVIDLQDLRVTLGGATKGDFGTMVVDVTATGTLDVVSVDRLPASVRAQVQSPDLDLQFLSADAIRIARSRGLISEADLASAEQKLLDETAASLASGMGGAVGVTGGFDDATLVPSASTGAGASGPVTFVARAHFLKPVAGGAPTDEATAAVALKTITQTFSLRKVQGFDTTYTVILPKGLDVASVAPSGASAASGTSADGRSQFVVTPQSDQASATVAIAVTPTFILAKFWPVVLLAVLLVLLLVGTPIAIVAVRRNRRKKQA